MTTGRRVAQRRMHNLRLSGAGFQAAEDVVRWLGAVQSQDYAPAKWSVAQRCGGVGDAVVEDAFAAGAILRTHVLRPTWHFVPPADIRWMLELTAPRVRALTAYSFRRAGLDDAVLKRCNTLLTTALRGGNQLTRKELAAMLHSAGIATDGFRLAYIVMNAELDGIVCSGPPRGAQHTYVLLDERAPQARSLPRDEALAELTLRYFTSHGPATAKDFRWWSSLTAAEVTKGLQMVGARLEHEVIDGVRYWFAGSARYPTAASPVVHLLHTYDEYIVGYSESRHLLDLSGAGRAAPRERGLFSNFAILDSQVAGEWKRTVQKDSVIIEVALYTTLDAGQQRALRAAADRHAQFLGRAPTVVTTQL